MPWSEWGLEVAIFEKELTYKCFVFGKKTVRVNLEIWMIWVNRYNKTKKGKCSCGLNGPFLSEG